MVLLGTRSAIHLVYRAPAETFKADVIHVNLTIALFTAVLPKRVQEGSHKCIHYHFDRSFDY